MMTKAELNQNTEAALRKGNHGLQTMWTNIPKGQRKKLLKDAEIKDTLDIYGI